MSEYSNRSALFHVEEARKIMNESSHWLDRISIADKVSNIIRMKSKSEGISLLDVGCAQGREVGELKKLGFTPYGIDINPEFIKSASKSYPDCKFFVGDLLDLPKPFSYSSFDIIVCLNTLFLVDVNIALHRIIQTLKIGGIGVFTLDEEIYDLEKNRIHYSLDVGSTISNLCNVVVFHNESYKRTDKTPFRHTHLQHIIGIHKVEDY